MSDRYKTLHDVLKEAFDQAATGKGAVRHAKGEPFEHQPILQIARRYGIGFLLGQAEKKMDEAQRLETEAAVRDLLGAINYLAAAVILRREQG